MSHDLTSVDSISFCPACKWGLLSISTSFSTNVQYVMWTYWFNIDDVLSLNVVTMVFSWLTFAIWCLCFGLLTMSERPNHCLYIGGGGGGKGVVNDALFTYTTYNITKKAFFTCFGEKFTSCLLCQILLSDFWNFYTKPMILMSWYFLSAQISAAAQLQPVFCKFQ